MMAVARHVRVLLDGAYVAMEVASAVLSPVLLVMASCAAADAHTTCQSSHHSNKFSSDSNGMPWSSS